MFSPAVAQLLLPTIIAASVALMLVRPRGVPEVYWIGGGVVLLLLLRLIHLRLAWRAAGIALDVCFFLIGMMLLCELAREHGVFDWLSAVAVRKAPIQGVILHSAPNPGPITFHHGLKLAVLNDIRKPVAINLHYQPILTRFHHGALRGEQPRGRNV